MIRKMLLLVVPSNGDRVNYFRVELLAINLHNSMPQVKKIPRKSIENLIKNINSQKFKYSV